ncbi:asparagine--tRNA ligase [[Mycoplasma] testudinis]|uniref:asparagine--tRNA ligase n=1 Tax=[Mycoplasma] testudinis TaxID=33924 RepID=UPI0004853839|nr:asparagine--tRNA ligase [[Mycoplasma] testudinis]
MEIIETKKLWKNYEELSDATVCLVGWIRANRESGKIGFIGFSDGSSLNTVQVVYKLEGISNYATVAAATLNSSVLVEGKLVVTKGSKQPFEIQATKIEILKEADASCPIQKKHHSNEFLRTIAHLRPRTNKFYSIMKIRNELSNSIFEFFKNNGFVLVNAPIMTSNDAEGAGEAFEIQDGPDFFNKKTLLSVTGQMASEAYAQIYKRVYTFGPTFRAEKSHTNKHLAEFWMIEPEIAFIDLKKLTIIMEQIVKHSIVYLFKYAKDELEYCNNNIDKALIDRLKNVVNNQFPRVEYREVISILKNAVSKNEVKFDNSNIFFGMDLGTEHERYICEKVYNSPTFIMNYPKAIKAFYMKQNEDGNTVAATDLLVPGIGELCGGSQREDSYQKLMRRCNELKMDIDNIQWYIDLRKYGYYRSSGFGLGFDRFVMYLTGCDNIRDVIPFPRSHGQLEF